MRKKQKYYLPWKTIKIKNRHYWVPSNLSEFIYWSRYWISYCIIPTRYKTVIRNFNNVEVRNWVKYRQNKLN